MTARLAAVIESTLSVSGIVAAVLVDSAGHAIEGASSTAGDLAAAARSASGMLKQWASVGIDLGIGGVRALLLERSGGAVAVVPGPDEGALMVAGNELCRPGRVRREAGLAREAVVEAARAAPLPASGFGAPGGIDEGRVPSDRRTAAEVVLVGAHTFRLVTKLAARLVQTKGVRSSRLRAYSPGSTVIDVVLEEGATLAAISRTCLGDLPMERLEEGPNRIVLRAAKPTVRVATPVGSPG